MNEDFSQYVSVTAAYNEEGYVERTIQPVVAQTLLPQRWIVVSDGSTDRIDEIVQTYSAKYILLQLLRVRKKYARNCDAQVGAINFGCRHSQDFTYQFIANLDTDVSFKSTHYADLLQRFEHDPKLGLACGFICEDRHGRFESRTTNQEYSVVHAVQMFRRECFEAIGGYLAPPHGGPDRHAQIKARTVGWHVVAFPELREMHQRLAGSGEDYMSALFRQGRMDYSLGSDPVFEILKIVRRSALKPYVLGSLALLSGFLWGYLRREQRLVSDEFIRFLRNDQMHRVRKILWGVPHKAIPVETRSTSA